MQDSALAQLQILRPLTCKALPCVNNVVPTAAA